ncbi:Poly A polymerase regulatory subunit, putative [Angomonas deanei]|uniref:Cap-specific mRNA (nucleoside-2'-O-)-methyltransferase n=1 Tax=Angomonas deanei TaxID=59799 RepID=A0A7G2CLN5_9TRYP|nr:Poly A polymerase regulatory subunit, putative [Angomonas deanei]
MFDKSRILSDESPPKVYEPSEASDWKKLTVKGLHYGQRKLLLSEVEVLTVLNSSPSLGGRPILVVYAGAAPGLHIPFLCTMFPQIKMVLIDPAPFSGNLQKLSEDSNGPILELINDVCTDELCIRLSRDYGETYYILFISDIRTGNPSGMKTNVEHTKMMEMDNNLQKSWCFSIRADAALLKFHPPYPAVTDKSSPAYDENDTTPSSITYLDGVLLWGVWAPKSSSEIRLFVNQPFSATADVKERSYNCSEHEQKCYYYNTDSRYAKDCEAERLILQRYIDANLGGTWSCASLSEKISEELGFALFTPLAEGFSEDNARWVSLLYSTRNPANLSMFEQLRSVMTFKAVYHLVSTFKDSDSIPKNEKTDGVELGADFWKVFCRGNFAEAYSFPKFRWNFYSQLFGANKSVGKRRR